MSRTLNPKKRFLILQRDNFTCQYCWLKASQGIHLQIDHKIPVSKWWNNNLDNLITSCFECNIWKWNTTKEEINEVLYKTKINDNTKAHLDLFLKYWNLRELWNIDWNTMALLSIAHKEYLSWNNYQTSLDTPYFLENKKHYKWNMELLDIEFKKWVSFCENVLSFMEWPFWTFTDMEIELFEDSFENILNDKKWAKWWDCYSNYNKRLNYELTELLISCELKNDFSIKKFSYFYNEIKNG